MRMDSLLQLDCRQLDQCRQVTTLLKRAGFSGACIEPIAGATLEDFSELNQITPLRLFSRKSLQPNNKTHLSQLLKRHWQQYDVLAVFTKDAGILEMAARDSRVGLIATVQDREVVKLTRGIVSLIKQNQKAIELVYNPLIHTRGSYQARIVRKIANNVRMLRFSRHPLVLGSGARGAPEIIGSQQLVTISNEFFNIPLETARKGVTRALNDIILTQRARKSPDHIFDGVTRVQEPGA